MIPECLGLLAPEVTLNVVEHSGTRTIIVKETGRDAKLKSLEIRGLADGDIAFTLDHQPSGTLGSCFKQLSCYLNVQHDKINKGCDFVILTRLKGALVAVLGDMKSNKPRVNEVSLQLKNSELFVKYLLSLVKAWHGVEEELKFKRVCVHTGRPMTKKKSISRKKAFVEEDYKVHCYVVQAGTARLRLGELLE